MNSPVAAIGPGIVQQRRRNIRTYFSVLVFASYATLLAVVTAQHEMWRDELQAWLIARDSATLPVLFHNLRYEGHPSLWYLLLFLPAHFSRNPLSLQVVNFFAALANAWLIASHRSVSRPVRAALVFSFFGFYLFGVTARSYMLAFLLLTAAARCLLGSPQRKLSAGILLGLAANTHVFAIPVAAALLLVLDWLPHFRAWSVSGSPPSIPRSAAAAALFAMGVAAAYLTIHPPADMRSAYYGSEKLAFLPSMVLATHGVWAAILPIPRSYLPFGIGAALEAHPEQWNLAHVASCAVLVVAVLALGSTKSRLFFFVAVTLELAAFAVTVRYPQPWHYGFIFVAFALALLIDTTHAEESRTPWLSRRVRQAILAFILVIQCAASAGASVLDLRRPYSGAEQASLWLRSRGYAKNPLVVDPGTNGPALVGYLKKDSAYYPECRCFQSFIVWNSRQTPGQPVTPAELDRLRIQAGLPVVLVSNHPLDRPTMASLHLNPLPFSVSSPILPSEAVYIYLH